MEGLKEKKTRDVGFENIKDPNIKSEIMTLVQSPNDATNFIFWFSKSNTDEWGLTLKSIPKKTDKEGFPSQHTWKITWFYKLDSGDAKLCVANHCKALAGDVSGSNFARVLEIYNTYRNK